MINTTYGPFSKEPEYLELNKCFVRSIVPRLKGLDCIVDLACGTGTLTELLPAELRDRGAPSASVDAANRPFRTAGCPRSNTRRLLKNTGSTS